MTPPFEQSNVDSADDEIIDANEAGRLLKVHPKTVRRMAAKGVIPGKRVGSVWRFRKSLLDAWFDAGVESNAPRALAGQRRNL